VKDNAARRIINVAALDGQYLDGQYMEEPLAGCSLSDGEKYTSGLCLIPECENIHPAMTAVRRAK
jgi:hypothetical protein